MGSFESAGYGPQRQWTLIEPVVAGTIDQLVLASTSAVASAA